MTDRFQFSGTVISEGRNIRGSVNFVGQRTFRDGEWVEVDVKAFNKADINDVLARWDHDPKKVLGRTRNGTLSFSRTPAGFDYEITNLPNTSYANDALELVGGGYTGGSSFSVGGKVGYAFSRDPIDGSRVRRITSFGKLVDIAPVIDPAFPSEAATFSEESEVTDKETNPPAPEPEPEPEKRTVKFSAEPSVRDGAEKFARALSLEAIEQQMDAMMDASDGNLKGDVLARYEGFASVYEARKAEDAETTQRAANLKAFHDARLGRAPKAPSSEFTASKDYEEAFSQYLRTGNSRHMEQFAQSIAGSGAEGGYTVPDGFLTRVTERMVAYGGIASQSETITTATGESLRWPSNDDTANSAAIAAEGVAGAAGADLVFGNITLGAFSYDANGTGNVPVKVSLELLQDSAFDIASFIGRKLGERLGRKQSADLALGGGTTEPVGLFTKTPDTMTATDASLAYVEHILQVNSAYRDEGNCSWIMSDTTLGKFWASQAGGVPVFTSDMNSGISGKPSLRLGGYPITIDAAAADLVAFGDIRRAYIIRRVRGVQVMVDPYTLSGVRQVAYHAWARMDANLQDQYAVSISDYAGVSAAT